MRKSANTNIVRLVYAAMFLALAILLPFLTGQIPEIGKMLCPMHIPVLLCGFICGKMWGFAVGASAPLLRSLMFGMPPLMPTAAAMAFELAVYGLIAGMLYHALPKKLIWHYFALICAMLAGRAVWGLASYIIAGINNTSFGFDAFVAGAFTASIPGIILQIALIPPIIYALRKNRLMLN